MRSLNKGAFSFEIVLSKSRLGSDVPAAGIPQAVSLWGEWFAFR